MPALKSNFSGSLSVGRTFYLHRPIGKFLRFGIDATWFDLNYTNYKIKHITHSETNNYQYHQGELAVQVGPSITLKPVGKFHTRENMAKPSKPVREDYVNQTELSTIHTACGKPLWKTLWRMWKTMSYQQVFRLFGFSTQLVERPCRACV
jgi:hypothetical protein